MTTETTIAETTGHQTVSFWKGEEPGSCGFECSCGDVFDGFNTVAEAEACHKPLKVERVEPVKPESKPDPRTEYIAGLRALADLLEQNPDLEPPYHGYDTDMLIIPRREAQRAVLAAWARALPGRKDKTPSGDYFRLTGGLRGLKLMVLCDRGEVCEKRVLRTETVTETVPDPVYVAAAPLVERETEREIVEWVCAPSILTEPEPEAVSA